MKVVACAGNPEIAMVYVVDFDGRLVECVEAIQPPRSRMEKWVLMISTLYGCPIGCRMCDAGGHYRGKLTAEEMFAQITHLISTRFPDGQVPSQQFKIQLARMGEPALNDQVLEVLQMLPDRYPAPGLMPSLSTIAPHGRDAFFERLIDIKNDHYAGGRMQFQFSVHTTDQELRQELIPVKTWDYSQMAAYGERYYRPGDRKVTLNFALAETSPVEVDILREYFDPAVFVIKITPLNPTYQAQNAGLKSYIGDKPGEDGQALQERLVRAGYQVFLSIGEVEENMIGSNCGQYVQRHLRASQRLSSGYTYPVREDGERTGLAGSYNTSQGE